MKFQIQGVPRFSFTLDMNEVDALVKLALLHYDFSCKREAAEGGIIQQWKKELLIAILIREHQEPGEEPHVARLEASFRDLDRVAKICEPMNMTGLPDDLQEVAAKVYMAFMSVMKSANDTYSEWQLEVETRK
jgi:hypothetical protein